MRAKVTYKVRNVRLDERKTRTLTVNVQDEAFRNWNVDAMLKECYSQLVHREAYDSSLWITKIKVGRTEFIL